MKVKYAITTTSGTTALHLALISLGIGPDDAVFIPDLTMIAVPCAVLYTGASPVPIDVDPETYNINPQKIRDYLTSQCRYDPKQKAHIDTYTHKTIKAILPVHLYGHPCDMHAIKAIAEEYGLLVIEDAAEAHGAMFFEERDKEKGMYAGAIGDVGCFSFYANKIITTGEGGMVVTNSEKSALKEKGIDSRSFFVPVHKQPVFQQFQEKTPSSFPGSTQLSKKGLYLPSGLALTSSQIQEVCQAILDIQKSP